MNAYDFHVFAYMPVITDTLITMIAWNMSFSGDTIAHFYFSDLAACFHDISRKFMPKNHRRLYPRLRILAPWKDVKVGTAYRGRPNFNQDIPRADFRYWKVCPEFGSRAGKFFVNSTHDAIHSL
jgi:hypothetical protein